jgi:hypothetical protein
MKNTYLRLGILIGIFSFLFVACDDNIDPLVEELDLSRVLTPKGLTARIRNNTTIELTWELRADAEEYVVEFSEDSLKFNTIIKTATVQRDELPYQAVFDGGTRYSARVKGVGADIGDSNWIGVTIMTDQENIFLPVQDGDIEAVSATVRWPANSDVTNLIINPGGVDRPITDNEKIAGSAIVTGLTGETDYTILLKKGIKIRGSVSFTTLIDLGGATAVHPEDDLNALVTAALPGDVLVLFPGDYTVFTGSIAINKSITIKGLYPYDKPKVHVQFSIENGASAVEIGDLDMNGDGTLTDVFRYNTASVTYGSLSITGCYIHDFDRSFIGGNVSATVQSVTVNNNILKNVMTNGGDFIDFRTAYLASLTITNSTFNNCAAGRDFIRMDAASGLSGTGLTTTVLIDHCTLFGVSNTQDRILYVRFLANSLTVQNTLIAGTDGYYSNQTNTSQPTCSNNNYFNSVGFFTPAYVSGAKIDISGSHTTLDPGFVNAAAGDFTITNQTLKDNSVGDPRWRQ